MKAEALRLVFMGSPDFAVPSLERLLVRGEVRAVVTQPDRPQGRGRSVAAPPVKLAAQRAGIPVLQPERVRGNRDFAAALGALEPDLAVVVAYGHILPRDILALPRYGCINVHASLLPRYRGAAPIVWAIANGEHETGVTIMQMDEGMDTGPILLTRACPISETDTAGTLAARLAALGAEALEEALTRLMAGTLTPVAQDGSQSSQAPLLRKEHGRVDFARPATAVRDWIRAMDPWPGAFTVLEGEMLRLFRPVALDGADAPPGTVIGRDRNGLWVACKPGLVAIGELQRPGRRRADAAAFLAGRPLAAGTLLGA